MEQPLDLLNNDLQVNGPAESILLDAARWGKFLSIMGFIFCGVMAVGAFFMANFVSAMQGYSYNSDVTSATRVTIIVVYVIFAVILFFPCLFLYRFSVKMRQAFKTVSQEYFESSLQNLKSMFKYVGILTIIFLVIWILSLVIVAIAAAGR